MAVIDRDNARLRVGSLKGDARRKAAKLVARRKVLIVVTAVGRS